jgi:hypothetical protein
MGHAHHCYYGHGPWYIKKHVFRKSIIARLLYVQLRGALGCLARGKSNLSFDATWASKMCGFNSWIARFPTKKRKNVQWYLILPYHKREIYDMDFWVICDINSRTNEMLWININIIALLLKYGKLFMQITKCLHSSWNLEN